MEIVDSTNLNTVFVTASYSSQTITYIHCVSSSLCVATDLSTSSYLFYKLTSNDFLGGSDTPQIFNQAQAAG